jgi:hypothetical protein
MGQKLSTAEFGSEWTGDGDSGFKFDVNSDGQSFTLTFAEIQAEVGSDKSPDLITARAFSAVMPVHGDGNDISIAFSTSGYAFANEGADAYVVLSVNGQTDIQRFAAGTDEDFVQQVIVKGVPTSQCHLAVVAVAQRDPAHPDATAALRPVSVDAEIRPSS